MEAVILSEPKMFTLFGFSKPHDQNQTYRTVMFELMDRVWEEVRNKKLSHTGINHVVYGADHMMFAGIELTSPPKEDSLLEKKMVIFKKYAYCKHIGPYKDLDKTYRKVHSVLEASGEQPRSPQMEIYGHWHEDESKLETEIIFNLGDKEEF